MAHLGGSLADGPELCAIAADEQHASWTGPAPAAPPTVTVIIPAYNSAWTIGRTLASLRAQTLADFQCVIVDDGSTDATADLVTEAIAGDQRFTFIPGRRTPAWPQRGTGR